MEIYEYNILFSELAKFDLVSLGFYVHGCPNNCHHCSWKENPRSYYKITFNDFCDILDNHKDIECILFLGGEWLAELKDYLIECKKRNLITALYTGLDDINVIDSGILNNLNIIKYGHWDEKLGGINSPTTNQKFLILKEWR